MYKVMAFFRTLLHKVQSLVLGLIRILHKALCCRRRRHEPEAVLPLLVTYNSVHSNDLSKEVVSNLDDWDSWDNKNHVPTSIRTDSVIINMDHQKPSSSGDGELPSSSQEEDFFKDMIPQFRKPKKKYMLVDPSNALVVKLPDDANQTHGSHSSRLSMDPDIISGPELGILEDNPTNWELNESTDELWDSESLIKEKKLAEREKRIAEHQRRKLEKEALRVNKKPVAFNKDNLHIDEIKDKSKYS